ncbi:MAG: HEAT repeat domain-containing protein [Pseudomonadota bacterium]
MEVSVLHSQCMALSWRDLLWLFGDLLQDAPEHTIIPALALREKARAGELPEEVIPLLVACLIDSEAPGTIDHLAKALAAFGRQAQIATPYLIDKLRTLHVTDDESFWTLDGCLHALGYLGGEGATSFLEELANLQPCPVTRAGAVYQGEIPEQDRRLLFEETLQRVREFVADDTLEGWRSKRTQRQGQDVETRPKLSPWMTR